MLLKNANRVAGLSSRRVYSFPLGRGARCPRPRLLLPCARPGLYILPTLSAPTLAFFALEQANYAKLLLLTSLLVFSFLWPWQNKRLKLSCFFLLCALSAHGAYHYYPSHKLLALSQPVVHAEAKIARILWSDDSGRKVAVLLNFGGGLRAYYSGDQNLLAHGRVKGAFRVKELPRPLNPGGFDLRSYLRSFSVYLEVVELGNAGRGQAGQRGGLVYSGAAPSLYLLRQAILGNIHYHLQSCLGKEHSALLLSLVFGLKQHLSAATKAQFRLAGMAHVMAVSGMHASFLTKALSKRSLRRHLPRCWLEGLALGLLLLWYYLSSYQVGLLRAILLRLAFNLSARRTWRQDKINTCALAASGQLLLRPASLLAPAFILSFAAICALLIFVPELEEGLATRFTRLPRPVCQLCAQQLALLVFLLSLNLEMFASVSLFALVSNVPAVLLCEFVFRLCLYALPLLYLSLILPFLSVLPQLLFGRFIALGLSSLANLARLTTTLPWGTVFQRHTGRLFLCALFLLVLPYISGVPRLFQGREVKLKRLCVLMAALCLFGLALGSRLQAEKTEICFLAVGQGDCLIVQKGKLALLIDGGRPENCWQEIIPYMCSAGIAKFDLAFLTHSHRDHAGGVLELLRLGRIKRLVVPRFFLTEGGAGDVTHAELSWPALVEQVAREQGVPLLFLGEHDKIDVDKDKTLSFTAYLPTELGRDLGQDPNEDCLVGLLQVAQFRLLLTADLTVRGENLLLQEPNLSCDLLKLAHHGSNSVNSSALLSRSGAKLALLSVGANPYGHPGQACLQRLREAELPTCITRDDGALVLRWSKEGVRAVTWRSGRSYLFPRRDNSE